MPLTELWLSKVSRKRSPGAERVRLADQLERAARVRGEDRDVLVGRGVEELEHGRAGPLDQLGHRGRGRVGRVRVAEDARPQQLEVLAQLRVGVQAAAGVVEIDVAARVEAGELAAAQLVEDRGVGVAWVRTSELRRPLIYRGCELRVERYRLFHGGAATDSAVTGLRRPPFRASRLEFGEPADRAERGEGGESSEERSRSRLRSISSKVTRPARAAPARGRTRHRRVLCRARRAGSRHRRLVGLDHGLDREVERGGDEAGLLGLLRQPARLRLVGGSVSTARRSDRRVKPKRPSVRLPATPSPSMLRLV